MGGQTPESLSRVAIEYRAGRDAGLSLDWRLRDDATELLTGEAGRLRSAPCPERAYHPDSYSGLLVFCAEANWDSVSPLSEFSRTRKEEVLRCGGYGTLPKMRKECCR